MATAWREHGPISLPPRPLAFGVGAALALLAFVGVGLGIRAAWKDTGIPSLGVGTLASADSADTLIAQPIVALTPSAANTAAATNVDASAENADAEIEAKSAEAQQVQSTASKSGADIDQILASPTEKPTAPAKAPAEAPPGPPVKSDVPF